jgi:hypothetical protein
VQNTSTEIRVDGDAFHKTLFEGCTFVHRNTSSIQAVLHITVFHTNQVHVELFDNGMRYMFQGSVGTRDCDVRCAGPECYVMWGRYTITPHTTAEVIRSHVFRRMLNNRSPLSNTLQETIDTMCNDNVPRTHIHGFWGTNGDRTYLLHIDHIHRYVLLQSNGNHVYHGCLPDNRVVPIILTSDNNNDIHEKGSQWSGEYAESYVVYGNDDLCVTIHKW